MPPSVVRDPPSTLGPFRLIRPLGQGGFAPVWLAEETYGGQRLRDVALKLFLLPAQFEHASPEAEKWRNDVANEARALCRVEHTGPQGLRRPRCGDGRESGHRHGDGPRREDSGGAGHGPD